MLEQRPTTHAPMSTAAASSPAHKRVARIVQQIAPHNTAAADTAVPQAKHAKHAPPVSLTAHLATLTPILGSDQSLPTLLLSLAAASAEISSLLRASTVAKIGSQNNFGDAQLNVDVDTHKVRPEREIPKGRDRSPRATRSANSAFMATRERGAELDGEVDGSVDGRGAKS